MTPFSANPGIFIFSVVLLVVVGGYFGWGAIDRLGLAMEQGTATVTGKHYNPPGVTYRTTIAGGRAWTQADSTNESYIVLLDIQRGSSVEASVAVVSKAMHMSIKQGDSVRIQMHRTRLSGKLEVIGVER
jgi:hypothetical protein